MTELQQYISTHILPLYDGFDAAHRRSHVEAVIEASAYLAQFYDVNKAMVYAIAAYHDTGLTVDRKTHHIESGRIIREDTALRQWFSEEEIETMAEAAEDHRASSDHEPRSLYGKIVAEADRQIDTDTIIRRTLQYGLAHYPELDRDGHIARAIEHLNEKYAEGGYLRLWLPESPNAERLRSLWALIADEKALQEKITYLWAEVTNTRYIVITRPDFWEGEAEAITHKLELGLKRLHIRKPGSTEAQREALLRAIPTCYHDRIVIGDKLMGYMANDPERRVVGHACHSIDELREWQGKRQEEGMEYLCLSPIFDSISKQGYKSAFSHEELLAAKAEGLINEHVMALGGISSKNIAEALSYGFGGVMVLGDAWL